MIAMGVRAQAKSDLKGDDTKATRISSNQPCNGMATDDGQLKRLICLFTPSRSLW